MNNEIRLFEAFAGYGSQRMALRNVGIKFKSVGVSEIDKDVILSYAAIHEDLYDVLKNDKLNYSKEEMIESLESINIPLDYKTFENKAKKLKYDDLKKLYIASKLIKNYGDIRVINSNSLPDFDLFTYSFPCQDISVAGYQKGLYKNSGTRSSLLWECCKIIEEKRPKYLMMENVKNLIGCNHINNFNSFLKYLESLGYVNSWKVLNARDYGIPQNRERVFCISILNGNMPFNFPPSINLTCKLNDILDRNVDIKYYLKNKQVLDKEISQEYSYCIDSNYWKGTSLHDFLEKHRRQLVTDKTDENGLYIPRRLTPHETWKLMGVNDDDFRKVEYFNSSTSLYKQAGNSIVVQVLESIFKKLFIYAEDK